MPFWTGDNRKEGLKRMGMTGSIGLDSNLGRYETYRLCGWHIGGLNHHAHTQKNPQS